MRKKFRGLYWLLSLILVMGSFMPANLSLIYAETIETSIEIREISQGHTQVQPGDSFSLEVKVLAENDSAEKLYIQEPTVRGSGIDSSKLSFWVTDNETIPQGGNIRTVTIEGLIYNGGDKSLTVEMGIGTNNPLANDEQGTVLATHSLGYTLSAKTTEDYKEVFRLENQENLIVVPGKTQNVSVKIMNKTSDTINQVVAELSLNSTVKGLKIKESEATIKNIKGKETRTAIFTITTTDEVTAGVYPATIHLLGTSYPINIQVDTSIAPSALEVSALEDKVFTPGVTQNATFTIKNVGDRDAKNVRLEVVNSENVFIVGGSNVKHIGTITAKKTQSVELALKVPTSVKATIVPVQMKLTYLSSTGEEKEDTQYVYLSTTATAASSEVVISNVISPTATYEVDENFNVKFNLSSKSGAENIKIEVTGDEGIVPKSQNLFFLDKLEKGASTSYTVNFAATSAADTRSHAIKIEVTYGEGPVVVNQYGSVNISNSKKDKEDDDEETKKGKPKVIIGEYEVNPVVVKAGENFELEIGFLNTHKNQAVHNLKANLKIVEQGENNTGNVFTPVNASNTFYIADLNPGEMHVKNITLYTIPNAKPKTYEVTLEMAYEDEEGNEIVATENIGIPVEQSTKVEIGEINVDIGQMGMETALTATVYNTGKTDVTNMIMYIEGEGFSVQDNKVFIGGFASQEQQSYEPTLIPEQDGILEGRLIIEYEDTTGVTHQVIETFSFQVEAPIDMGFDESYEDFNKYEEPPAPAKWPYVAGIGVGVLVAVIIIIVIIKKKKKKKEEMMLDED